MIALIKDAVDPVVRPTKTKTHELSGFLFIIEIYYSRRLGLTDAKKMYVRFLNELDANGSLHFFHATLESKPYEIVGNHYCLKIKNGGYCD